jgi:hypothetical protein
LITVKATREGLAGRKTSSGYRIDSAVPFVALPSAAALRLWIRVMNPDNGNSCRALVLDVGPWNENDNAYVFQKATLGETVVSTTQIIRPAAEGQKDQFGRETNGAGIDLGERVWQTLGMTDNGYVQWEFI